jgi:hypothetical protein
VPMKVQVALIATTKERTKDAIVALVIKLEDEGVIDMVRAALTPRVPCVDKHMSVPALRGSLTKTAAPAWSMWCLALAHWTMWCLAHAHHGPPWVDVESSLTSTVLPSPSPSSPHRGP